MSVEQEVNEQLEALGMNIETNQESNNDDNSENQGHSIESLAESYGWNPDGEKSAKEYVEYALKELAPRGKELKELKRGLNELKAHMQKVERVGYEKALRDLHQQRAEAIQMGDIETVNVVDQQIAEQQQAINDLSTQPPEVQEAVLAFRERNNKLLSDPSWEAQQIKEFFQKRCNEIESLGLDTVEALKIVEQDLHKYNPDYFGKAKKVSAVESETSEVKTVSKKKVHTFADLNKEQKQVAKQFERMGVMKVDDYIKQLEACGELK